ncbi:MAG: chromosome partitioning protein ParB [Spirochaetaceae bacterium]|nr:MAG: chromosome partitioning protein ParB [Spirochaetaceae bacterium]
MQVKIDSIIIRKRIRKDLGDLSSLKQSLKQHGLMNPIVITSDNMLIAGHRRFEAARQLGWNTITARIVDQHDEVSQIEMEIDENTQRKSLTTDELAEAYLRLDKLKNPGVFVRFFRFVRNLILRVFRRR